MKKKGLQTTPRVSELKRKFKVTHPFHPLFSKTLELVCYSKSYGRTYVEFFGDGGDVCSIPLEWTDAGGKDPFIEVSNGRAVFRTSELIRLMELVSDLSGHLENEL